MKKIMFNDKYGLTQAVLDGRKTMTRRFAHFEPIRKDLFNVGRDTDTNQVVICEGNFVKARSQYRIGEVVAIAQSYSQIGIDPMTYCEVPSPKGGTRDGKFEELAGWNNKMYVKTDLMPHHIQITGIRVEQLQDISDEDCLREGVLKSEAGDIYGYDLEGLHLFQFFSPREAFASIINHLCGLLTWHDNPHVFVYEFKLID